MFIAVIEWDEGTEPEVLLSHDRCAVASAVAASIAASREGDVGEVLAEHPYDPGIATDEQTQEWLDLVREATCVPWWTVYSLTEPVPTAAVAVAARP